MQLVISTSSNRPYLDRVLTSIQNDISIILVMDSTEDFLPNCDGPNIKKMLRLTATDEKPGYSRGGMNYVRCLQAAMGENTLLVEDDVVLHHNWWQDLHKCIAYIETVHKQYILSIGKHSYRLGNRGRGPLQYDYGLVREPVPEITNNALLLLAQTHARYYPVAMMGHIANIIDDIVKTGGDKYDFTIDSYMYRNHLKLFVSQVPLVTHIGKNSTMGHKWN